MLMHEFALLTHISTICQVLLQGEVIHPTPNWSSKSHGCAIPSHLDRLALSFIQNIFKFNRTFDIKCKIKIVLISTSTIIIKCFF